MNKVQLAAEVAKKTGLSKKDSASAVNAIIDVIKKNIKKGVTLIGFGTFKEVRRKARKGRNPQTGEAIRIKAKNVVKFKPGKGF
ncbi:HU family DNA-binding protein [candidate division KSB1 bacterium]